MKNDWQSAAVPAFATVNGQVMDHSPVPAHYAAMKHLLTLAGIAMLAATAPAYAKPDQAKHHAQGTYAYRAGGCPPGLAKKNNGCLPPGQAKKLYGVGQRVPLGYNGWTPYNQIPYDVRNRYDLDPYGRYIYDQNYVYRVDPTTMVVSQVLNAILR